MAEPETVDINNPLVQSAINDAVAAEVSGLKTNRDLILQEKKDLALRLERYKDIDPDKVNDLMQKIGQSEEAKLIADGKLDELIDKRTSSIKEEADQKITNLSKMLEDVTGKYDTVSGRFNESQIDQALQEAAIKAGVRPEALPDVLFRGRSVFSVAEDGTIEARNRSGELQKDTDGLLMDPSKFVVSLKKNAPHYWPDSTGSGLTGSTAASGDMQTRIDAAAASGNMTLYRKLREQAAKK